MILIRKEHPAFGWGNLAWAYTGTNAVAGYWRTYKDEKILVLNNLSSKSQQIEISLTPGDQSAPIELLTHTLPAQVNADKLYMQMTPYHYMWIKL